MSHIAMLGAGSWATAIAIHLAKKGFDIKMWARRSEQIEELNSTRVNAKYLPDIKLPDNILLSSDIAEVVKGSESVILGVPSHALRETCRLISPYLGSAKIIVNLAKGLEEGSLKRLTEVMAEEIDEDKHFAISVLSGPSHAEEVAKDIPTTVVAAAKVRETAEAVQDLFMSPNFRVYTNPDIIGVELGGALKNVIALACGISDGLGFGDNTKAAIMTRGVVEIGRLGEALGAKPLTFAGLSGVGDLIVTCTSMHSRNRRCGILIGEGMSVKDAINAVNMVVEGVRTTKVAKELAEKLGVEMPITNQLYQVLYEGVTAKETVSELMLREKVHEIEEVVEGIGWE